MKKKKIAKSPALNSESKKIAKNIEQPAIFKNHYVSWQFRTIDLEPNWSKKVSSKNLEYYKRILDKLKSFEGSNWNELERQSSGPKGKSKHHSVDVLNIIKEAQKRLKELHLDDIDQLFSLRLDGKSRVWGIRELGYLKILWFDPDHEMCPSTKD